MKHIILLVVALLATSCATAQNQRMGLLLHSLGQGGLQAPQVPAPVQCTPNVAGQPAYGYTCQ